MVSPRTTLQTAPPDQAAPPRFQHSSRPKIDTINWGGVEHRVERHERYTANDLNKIKTKKQKLDAVFPGLLAYAGTSGRLKFHTHSEVDLEALKLPG